VLVINDFIIAKNEVAGGMLNCTFLLHQGLLPLQRIKVSNTGVHVLLHGKTLLLENSCLGIIKQSCNNKKIIKRW
jgi:hypothetical protein